VMGENLSRMGRECSWLEEQLRSRGYRDVKEIFLGIYRPQENRLTLYPNEPDGHI
jgi:uncharacterized membrane protein YcaP (DUF421 family)